MNRAVALLLAAMALPTAGCSLLGLDSFEVPACTPGSNVCQPLNDANHIAATDCRQYQCVAGACVLGTLDADGDGEPAAACGGADCDDHQARVSGGAHTMTESCDGLDNDCNGMIDDGALVPSSSAGPVVSGIGGMSRLTYAHPSAGSTTAAYEHGTGGADVAGFTVVMGATASPATPNALAYESNSLESEFNVSMTGLTSGCSSGNTMCDVADLALDAAGVDRWFFAAVNTTSGCGGGQLRIGALEPGSTAGAHSIVLRGPAARSDVYSGVDVTAMNCTGASRASGMPGAARPAVGSSIPGRGFPQAVVAWLGDAVSRSECGGARAEVDALGVWLESDAATHTDWVNATGLASSAPGAGAVPQMLGSTLGGGAPSVVAAGGSYVVAYGNESGSLELRAVGAFGDPPPFSIATAHCAGVLPPPPPAGCQTPRMTDPLVLDPARTTLHTETPPDHVAIAIGPAQGSSVELGLAWQEGCGTATASIHFQRVSFTPAASGGSSVALGAPVVLTSAADHAASQPSLAYVPTGFVRAGFARGGATATDANAGGWLVVWIDAGMPSQVMARRVAEFDGAPLEPAQSVTAGSGSARLLAPTVYPSAASSPLALAYGDAVAGTIVGGGLLCAPPAP